MYSISTYNCCVIPHLMVHVQTWKTCMYVINWVLLERLLLGNTSLSQDNTKRAVILSGVKQGLLKRSGNGVCLSSYHCMNVTFALPGQCLDLYCTYSSKPWIKQLVSLHSGTRVYHQRWCLNSSSPPLPQVFCQLIKQTAGVAAEELDTPGVLSCWQTLACMCCTFIPERAIKRYLNMHLKK